MKILQVAFLLLFNYLDILPKLYYVYHLTRRLKLIMFTKIMEICNMGLEYCVTKCA